MIHQTVVELPLLTARKTFTFRLLTWILFITVPLLFISPIFWSGKIMLIFLVLFAVSAIPMQIMRSYEIIGTIRLTREGIIVDNEAEQLSFLLAFFAAFFVEKLCLVNTVIAIQLMCYVFFRIVL